MSGRIEQRLRELGIELPEAPQPIANYVPWTAAGNLVFVSGQGTREDGAFQYIGKLGRDFAIEEGYAAARICAVNLLSQLKKAVDGDLDRVTRVLRLGGYVNGTPDFTDAPKVINGASDLLVEVFGETGRHARTAITVASLPQGMAVEVDAFFLIG
jgi:enamine deaminase RidA (YjgF/YER057c/UK114 family)